MQMWQQIIQAGRVTMESWLKLNEITMRTVQRMVEQQFASAGECVKSATHHLGALSEAKSIQDIVMAQTRFAMEYGGNWMASASKGLEVSLQAQGELSQWMNDSIQRANSQIEKTAEQVRQAIPTAKAA
jgi:hypothetical protein